MTKNQLPHTWLDQFRDHKHVRYFSGKLYIKLFKQAANENTMFMTFANLFLIKNMWDGFY